MQYKKKKVIVRRKRPSKKLVVPRKVIKNNLVYIKRKFFITPNINFTVASGWGTSIFNFSLGNIPDASQYTNVFEQYRINAVKLTFIPLLANGDTDWNQALAVSGTQYLGSPRVYSLIDKDGVQFSTISTEQKMLEFSGVRHIRQPLKTFSVYISKPCVQQEMQSTIGFAAASPKPSPWIDCENYGIIHNSCVIGCAAVGSSTAALQYQVLATYYMQFKGAC